LSDAIASRVEYIEKAAERQTSLVDVRETARAFVAAPFDELRKDFVVPTPVFHPYVQVGRDYFGDTIHSVQAYHELEEQLNELYPHRFAEPLKRRHAEFASTYIFNFLEACIARCGRLGYTTGRTISTRTGTPSASRSRS
jgi:hypothetical protein